MKSETIGEVAADDRRFGHHEILIRAGYALDRTFESIAGLRVYRKNWGIHAGSNSVDVFLDGSWGKYGERGVREASGYDLETLRKEFASS
jgi:hypothetical protein